MTKQTPSTPVHAFLSLHCSAFRHHACDIESCQCTCHHAVANVAIPSPVAATGNPSPGERGAVGDGIGMVATAHSDDTGSREVAGSRDSAVAEFEPRPHSDRPVHENTKVPASDAGTLEQRAS